MDTEIIAWCKNPERIREILKTNNAEFQGKNHIEETYFQAKTGELILREENEKSQLIYSKQGKSDEESLRYNSLTDSSLKAILSEAMATTSIIEMERESYSFDNVSISLDKVKALGQFVKIRATNPHGNLSSEKLTEQLNYYFKLLEINAKNLVKDSCRDLLKQNSLFSQVLIDDE
ncbi:MAG: CYTH domain-containing protein [Marinifilaceae bacterium]